MRKIRILLVALIIALGAMLCNKTYATNETRSLGALEERPFTKSTYKFRSGANGLDKVYTVVKIYDNNDKDEQNNFLYSKALYCLRGGLGFGANDETDVSKAPIEYTEIGEMHENASEIIAKYKEYYNIDLDRTETINGKEVNIYNAILWVLDEAYLPVDGTKYSEAEYKEELLTRVGIPKASQEAITKDDIEVIQQLAIWYFANYDEQKSGDLQSVSVATKFPAQFLSINNNNNIDSRREENLNKIYQYFIYNAIDNSTRYQGTEQRNKYVGKNEFDKELNLEIKSIEPEETIPDVFHPELYYYEIGPFKVKSNIGEATGRDTLDLSNIVLYDANGKTVKRFYEIPVENETGETTSGGFREVYTFVDSRKNKVTEIEKGMEYYIRFKKDFEKGFKLGDVTTSIPEEEKYDMSSVSLEISSSYSLSKATFLIRENADQPVVEISREKLFENDKIVPEDPKEFDLSLRKFITVIRRGEKNIEFESRVPQINTNTLINGIDNRDGSKEYTATYTHSKKPLEVETGDRVIYTIRVYNEGEAEGTATSVTDYLPEGLKFIPASESKTNSEYGWKASENDERIIVTEYLKDTTIKAFDKDKTEEEKGWQKATTGKGGLYYADLQIECEVVAKVSREDQNLRNIAAITDDSGDDRDSKPGDPGRSDYIPPVDNSTYKEDDDDYEDLLLPKREFDLSLRKYISTINGTEPEVSRVPQIDTSKLNTIDNTTGEKITTATYKHSKEPLTVKKGDIVTYKIRIYNEGQIDGYATKVTDYLPDGLGFLYTATGDINPEWFLEEGAIASPLYGKDGIYDSEENVLKKEAYKKVFGDDINLSDIQVVQGKEEEGTREMLAVTAGGTVGQTNIKATELIKAYKSDKNDGDLWQQSTNNENDGLFYQELEITCIVLKENTYTGIIKNVAEITAAQDVEENEIKNVGDDRDSEPNNVYEDQNHTPKTEIDGYTPGEQDDDDFEPLQLKYFDLALRKFITGVETNGKVENVTSRIPNPEMGEDGNIIYKHSKEPVYVANNDIVTYTIRVYNEGTIAGYAEEVTDDIPEGLEYLPEHTTNQQYEWVMRDKDGNVTEKVEEAVKITTDYLSSEKEKKTTDEETESRNNIINPFDSSKEISKEVPLNPDYKDVKVAFKVTEPSTSDRIIINSAQISEDSDDDEDSVPKEWNDGEDDQDKEYIYVKYFDLSLLKWVTKTIVTVDGKTTTTETGFKPNTGKTESTGIRDNKEAEPIAKVELDRKKLSKTTVKFAYKIKVTNEGEIEGYATEITDFIPNGLEFKAEDNKAYGWTKEGDNKVTTRALETKLLKPGESAEVEIIFTWKNDANNLEVKTNIAEITEDYNGHNSKDIDSTPDNKKDPYEKEQEDDDDFALVILSIKTGKGASYTLFITAMITLLTTGIYLVKKYVLTY